MKSPGRMLGNGCYADLGPDRFDEDGFHRHSHSAIDWRDRPNATPVQGVTAIRRSKTALVR